MLKTSSGVRIGTHFIVPGLFFFFGSVSRGYYADDMNFWKKLANKVNSTGIISIQVKNRISPNISAVVNEARFIDTV